MDRRKFLGLFSAGVAGIALEQAIPLGRVWSFPKNIVIANALPETLFLGVDWGFGIDRTVYDRTYYRRSPDGIVWSRREISKGDGSWAEIHGWQEEPLLQMPFVLVANATAAFPPDSSHTPS